MTVGQDTFMGLGLPRVGQFEILQRTAATDVATITGTTGQTGDFLVCRLAAGTEKFVVDVDGLITAVALTVTGAVSAATITGTSYLTSKDNGTVAFSTTTLAANGAFGFAVVSGTARVYFRSGGTVYYADLNGSV